jgi:hypothetical protein
MKFANTIKKVIAFATIIATLATCAAFPVHASTKVSENRGSYFPRNAVAQETAINFAHRMYPCKIVRVVDTKDLTTKQLTHRKGVIYIEKITSFSNGNHYGTCLKQYQVYHTRKVSKNKRVVTYAVYNPCDNFIDDITGIVDTTAPNFIR